jgi:hypothetical protein
MRAESYCYNLEGSEDCQTRWVDRSLTGRIETAAPACRFVTLCLLRVQPASVPTLQRPPLAAGAWCMYPQRVRWLGSIVYKMNPSCSSAQRSSFWPSQAPCACHAQQFASRLHLNACHQQASSPTGVTDELGHHEPSTKQVGEDATNTLDIAPRLTIMRASQKEVVRMMSVSSDHTA